MKNVAIIAYWEWDFDAEVEEKKDNYGDDPNISYYHIKNAQSIPEKILFDEVIASELSEDMYSVREMQQIESAIPRRK